MDPLFPTIRQNQEHYEQLINNSVYLKWFDNNNVAHDFFAKQTFKWFDRDCNGIRELFACVAETMQRIMIRDITWNNYNIHYGIHSDKIYLKSDDEKFRFISEFI